MYDFNCIAIPDLIPIFSKLASDNFSIVLNECPSSSNASFARANAGDCIGDLELIQAMYAINFSTGSCSSPNESLNCKGLTIGAGAGGGRA